MPRKRPTLMHGATLQGRLESLQQEYVDKQTQQNLLDKLLHVESLQELQRAASVTPQTRKAHIQAHLELQGAVKERVAALRQLEQLAQQVEQRELTVGASSKHSVSLTVHAVTP